MSYNNLSKPYDSEYEALEAADRLAGTVESLLERGLITGLTVHAQTGEDKIAVIMTFETGLSLVSPFEKAELHDRIKTIRHNLTKDHAHMRYICFKASKAALEGLLGELLVLQQLA